MGIIVTPRRRRHDRRRRQAEEDRWAARGPRGELTSSPDGAQAGQDYLARMAERERAVIERQAAQTRKAS